MKHFHNFECPNCGSTFEIENNQFSLISSQVKIIEPERQSSKQVEIEKDDDWDYKTVLRIEPYTKHSNECQSYALLVRGILSNKREYVEDDSWVNICILDPGDLVDLIRNCTDQLDTLEAKEKFEETFNQN